MNYEFDLMRDLTDLSDYCYSMMGCAETQEDYDHWTNELVKVETQIMSFMPVMEDK